MIISASRRTDIPAFYSEWFLQRIRAGYCTLVSPFNSNQVTRVNLLPEAVDCIVFWTRFPRPLLPALKELDTRGYRYYFQISLLGYPREIEPRAPSLEKAINGFKELSTAIGPEKVIWRYDPILFTSRTDVQYHADRYRQIAAAIRDYTQRSVISIMDAYRKTQKRMRQLSEKGFAFIEEPNSLQVQIEQLMPQLSEIAQANGLSISSCAEEHDLCPYGIQPGKCIDDALIQKLFNIPVAGDKDPSQRPLCGCTASKDIGMYNSCLFGCQYCYACSNFDTARNHYHQHNPGSPSLIGWHEHGSPGRKKAGG